MSTFYSRVEKSEFKAAQKSIDEAVRLWPSNGRYHAWRGYAASQEFPSQCPADGAPLDAKTLEQIRQAAADYRHALELNSRDAVAHHNLAWLDHLMDHDQEARREWEQAAVIDPGTAIYHLSLTGEEVSYQYDTVNRLVRAETTDASWGNAYTYDGWGNLTAKSVTKGTAPVFSASYDPSTNMQFGAAPPTQIDPNRDVEDRWIPGDSTVWPKTGGGSWLYDPNGKRVQWTGPWGSAQGEIDFYGIGGQVLARYSVTYGDDGGFYFGLYNRTQHIGGQLTNSNGTGVTTDRLGSVRAKDNGERYTYFPYGEPRTESVAGGGLYAGLESPARKYDPVSARFDRPDPLGMGGVVMGDPGSWNRFAYAGGDPVNRIDPNGLADFSVTGYCHDCGSASPNTSGLPGGLMRGLGGDWDMFMPQVGDGEGAGAPLLGGRDPSSLMGEGCTISEYIMRTCAQTGTMTAAGLLSRIGGRMAAGAAAT